MTVLDGAINVKDFGAIGGGSFELPAFRSLMRIQVILKEI
jgi:hypothetical protein